MDSQKIFQKIKQHPDFDRVGMILCHNGIVRSTSRSGRPVKGLMVSVNHDRLKRILADVRLKPGIVDVQVEIAEDQYLAVGEDVMLLLVAGDVRENVLSALQTALEAIKTTATRKTEFFA